MNLRYRSRHWWLATALVIAAASIGVSAQGTVFKSGVDMVPLTVTVTNAQGHYVTGLTGDDFAVFEDGEQQPIAFFAREQLPLDLALVLDTSGSIAPSMPLVRDSAMALVRRLRIGDRSAVTAVHTSVVMPQPLTADLERVVAAIGMLRTGGGTALYDGLYLVLNQFARQRREQPEARRQVVVVLTDGLDTASHVTADDVARAAGSVGVSIYVIAMTGPKATSQEARDMTAERAVFELRALAQDSGGRVFHPTTALELPAIAETISQELASQYDIAYSRTRLAGGGFRRVAVRVRPPTQASVRARTGYRAVEIASRTPGQD